MLKLESYCFLEIIATWQEVFLYRRLTKNLLYKKIKKVVVNCFQQVKLD